MLREYDRKLILEDGKEYYGYSFGANTERICEIVFNTSMAGYQEILSDPSYTYQAVVMTYPLIGSYGMTDDDYETSHPTLGAFIVGDYNDNPSNYKCSASLNDIMKKYNIPGIYGIDTRSLVRNIRDLGSRKVLLTDISTDTKAGLAYLKDTSISSNAVSTVNCRSPYTLGSNNSDFHVVVIDCGAKQNIIRSLLNRNCQVTIVPYNSSSEYISSLEPNGVLVSNGPGNPEDVPEVITTLKNLRKRYPIFGICLGHQLICLSYGAKCYKLKFCHHGGNHPVINKQTGKIEITSQNHSYAVDKKSLAATPLTVTHMNLLDNTIEGVCCDKDRIFSVQYHPESSPGPEDSAYLFNRFIDIMQNSLSD